jgi:class 3 adenylate cyclase
VETFDIYLPMDRRQAIAEGRELPDRAEGSALFADISGFTPLAEALAVQLGSQRGVEELTHQLNRVYEALIVQVHRYGGSVIGFVGDAITCWFDGDDGLRATACALAMQRAIAPFAEIEVMSGITAALTIKVGIANGPVRRFRVGDPRIQYIDTLAGDTLRRMSLAEGLARRGAGEVVLDGDGVGGKENCTAAMWMT